MKNLGQATSILGVPNNQTVQMNVLEPSLFHQKWWLATAAGDTISQVTFNRGEGTLGSLSFVVTRKIGFRILQMPNFTHVLGPAIDSGAGKPQTRLMKRLSITRALIDQLPPFDFFKIAIDPSLDDGLALADGLAFQDRGFKVSPQYTFQIDCRPEADQLWDGMHFKVRQHIRRAAEKYDVISVNDAQTFIQFYNNNIRMKGIKNRIDFARFPNLLNECNTRSCGLILAAVASTGEPAAMTFLAWGNGTMYYLLSTKGPDPSDNGSVNLLIWSAMKKANELGLVFDLDGVYTGGSARFLSGFGGQVKTRLVATRARAIYSTMRGLRQFLHLAENDSSKFVGIALFLAASLMAL